MHPFDGYRSVPIDDDPRVQAMAWAFLNGLGAPTWRAAPGSAAQELVSALAEQRQFDFQRQFPGRLPASRRMDRSAR